MKLIIDIPDKVYEGVKALIAINFGGRFSGKGLAHDSLRAIKNGIPLDDIDSDETRAYFDGQAYGWEEGRKALIDEVKTEIKRMEYHMIDCDVLVSQEEVLEILDNIGKTESEGE